MIIIDNNTHPIVIRKVKEPFGWMGNMSSHPIIYQEKEYKTTEHLFQALRFKFIKHEAIAENIRNESNPMKAKMIAKSNYNLLIDNNYLMYSHSSPDIVHMKLCLELKLNAYPELMNQLRLTDNLHIIEDCSNRASLSGLFWGMKYDETFNLWIGENILGTLWEDIRSNVKQHQLF